MYGVWETLNKKLQKNYYILVHLTTACIVFVFFYFALKFRKKMLLFRLYFKLLLY